MKSLGVRGDVSLEDPFEFNKGFVVKTDRVEVLSGNPAFPKTIVDGVSGEIPVVFSPCETLLLGCCNHMAVLKEAGRRVVIKTGNTEDFHPVTPSLVKFGLTDRKGNCCRNALMEKKRRGVTGFIFSVRFQKILRGDETPFPLPPVTRAVPEALIKKIFPQKNGHKLCRSQEKEVKKR